jgi:hypothetical protein
MLAMPIYGPLRSLTEEEMTLSIPVRVRNANLAPSPSLPIAVFRKTQLSHSLIGNLLTDRRKVAECYCCKNTTSCELLQSQDQRRWPRVEHGIEQLSVSGLPLLDPHQGVFSVGERGHRLTERRPPFLGEASISGQGRQPTPLKLKAGLAGTMDKLLFWLGIGAAQKGAGSKLTVDRHWVVSFVVGILIAVLIAAGAFILLVSQQ